MTTYKVNSIGTIYNNKKMPTASQLPRPSIEGTEKVDNTAYI